MKPVALLALVLCCVAFPAGAHEVRPAYLEIVQTGADTYDVLWKVPAAGEDLRLGLYLRLPPDVRLIGEPVGTFTGRSFVERSRISRAGGLVGGEIHVDGLSATLTDALVRIERDGGGIQIARLTPDRPSFVVEAAPGRLAVAATYVALGVEHILFGVDHLLFVLALLMLVDGWRRLAWTVTAFTLAHSLTLVAATLGWVAVPAPPVEAVIALSIAFVAAEVVHGGRGRPGLAARAPWVVAFAFGLLHGLGFAGALREIGLPERQIPLALLAFNAGVELGQLLFVAGVLLLAALPRRVGLRASRRPVEAAAYGIGAVAMFWVIDRIASFWG